MRRAGSSRSPSIVARLRTRLNLSRNPLATGPVIPGTFLIVLTEQPHPRTQHPLDTDPSPDDVRRSRCVEAHCNAPLARSRSRNWKRVTKELANHLVKRQLPGVPTTPVGFNRLPALSRDLLSPAELRAETCPAPRPGPSSNSRRVRSVATTSDPCFLNPPLSTLYLRRGTINPPLLVPRISSAWLCRTLRICW